MTQIDIIRKAPSYNTCQLPLLTSRKTLAFIDELVDSRVIRNRREIVIRALENSVKFQMHKWNGSLIFIHGVRQAVISSGCMKELIDGISRRDFMKPVGAWG